jgi:ketopantoate reductase
MNYADQLRNCKSLPDAASAETAQIADLLDEVWRHQQICSEVLAVVERESVILREGRESERFESYQAKKTLLPKLNQSLDKIRQHRIGWQRLSPAERAKHVKVPPLLRQSQDLVMKIIFLDRENEQILLRRGLVPAPHLPPANRQRPHFVADLYRRGGGPG